MPALDKVDNAVTKSKALLLGAEPHPHDIEKLLVIRRQIVDSDLPENTSVEKYKEAFLRLFRYPTKFVPNVSAQSIGELVSTPRTNESITKLKLVFEKELPVDNQAKYIPCVANLGNDFYAIAHPTTESKPSNAIDIYKLPGDFQRTITDHVNPVYDMAATPDGQLAVLSDGQTQDSCSVRLFDPATGLMIATRDVHVRSPISFDVNLWHEYCVLSRTGYGQRKVTTVDESGKVKFTKVVDRSVIPDASRIACCGRPTILMGKTMMCDAMNCKELYSDPNRSHKDISATWFGEVNACYIFGKEHKFLRFTMINNKMQQEERTEICTNTDRGAKAESRLSVGGGYIVSSQDHTIRVFKEAE